MAFVGWAEGGGRVEVRGDLGEGGEGSRRGGWGVGRFGDRVGNISKPGVLEDPLLEASFRQNG